jgi:hypothetical protein
MVLDEAKLPELVHKKIDARARSADRRQSGSDPTKNQAIPSDDSRQAPTHLAIAPQRGMLLFIFLGLASGEFPRPAASLGLLSRFRPTISATQPNIGRVPPRKPSLALGVVSLAPGRPRKMGQEKGDSKNVLPIC